MPHLNLRSKVGPPLGMIVPSLGLDGGHRIRKTRMASMALAKQRLRIRARANQRPKMVAHCGGPSTHSRDSASSLEKPTR